MLFSRKFRTVARAELASLVDTVTTSEFSPCRKLPPVIYVIDLFGTPTIQFSSVVDDVCMIVVMADCPHTIGVEFGTRIIEVSGQKIKLQIWDTAGTYPS